MLISHIKPQADGNDRKDDKDEIARPKEMTQISHIKPWTDGNDQNDGKDEFTQPSKGEC